MSSSSPRRKSPADSSFADEAAHDLFDVDTILRSLAHPRRREILAHLDAEPTWERAELANNMGTIDHLASQSDLPDAEVALIHHHLPQLVDADLVSIDDEFDRIERGPYFDLVRDMVDAAVDAVG